MSSASFWVYQKEDSENCFWEVCYLDFGKCVMEKMLQKELFDMKITTIAYSSDWSRRTCLWSSTLSGDLSEAPAAGSRTQPQPPSGPLASASAPSPDLGLSCRPVPLPQPRPLASASASAPSPDLSLSRRPVPVTASLPGLTACRRQPAVRSVPAGQPDDRPLEETGPARLNGPTSGDDCIFREYFPTESGEGGQPD